MAYSNPVPAVCADIISKQAKLTAMISENIWRNKIYDEDVEYNYDGVLDAPYKGLQDGITALKNMREQLEELYEFINNAASGQFQPIVGEMIEWRNNTIITTISKQYIEKGFARRVAASLEDFLKGKTTYQETISKFTEAGAVEQLHDSFYHANVPFYMTTGRLGKYNDIKPIVITRDVARLKFSDWLIQLIDCRIRKPTGSYDALDKSSYEDTVKFVKNGFKNIYRDLDNQYLAAKTASSGNKFQINQLDTLFSYIYRTTFEIESRIVILLYKHISANFANARNLYALYTRVTKWKNGLVSEAYMEGYDDEDWGNVKNVSLTNSAPIIEVAKSTIAAITNAYSFDKSRMDSALNIMRSESPALNNALYTTSQDFFEKLLSRTYTLLSSITNAGEKTFQDMLAEAQLISDPEKYVDWVKDNCDPIPTYESPLVDLIIGDLCSMLSNISKNSANLRSLMNRVSTIKDQIEKNINNTLNIDTGEAVNWCDNFINVMGKVNVILGWMYRKRLVKLADLAPIVTPYQSVEPVCDKSYLPLHPEDDVDVMIDYAEECAEEMLTAINRKYANIYMKKLHGELYLEADGDGNSDGGNTKPVVHDSSTGGNDNQQQQKDGSSDNSGENKDNNQNNNGNNQDGEKKNSGKIVDKVKSTWQKIKDILAKLASDGLKEKNLKFLSENRDFLISRNYTNTSVEMLPYIAKNEYTTTLRECITKASQLTDATLKNSNEDSLRTAIFSGVTMPKSGEGLQSDMVYGLKVGAGEMKVTTVSDNALKEKIPGMIAFCEYYYNKFETDLNGLEADIGKLSILDGKSGSGEGDNTDKNKGLVATYLQQAMTAARIASRDRCNDYLKILSGLAASNKKKKKNSEAASEESSESKKE